MRFAKKATLLAALAVSAPQTLPMGKALVAAQPNDHQPGAAQPDASQASSAGELQPIVLNSRVFNIPVSINDTADRPVQVELYVARGAQSSWQLLDQQPPTIKEFHFAGNEDGVFWFATRTLDASGHPSPSGPVRPQLKVLVDTSQPVISVAAEADASGRVDAQLTITDATPVHGLQVQYATDTAPQWHSVDVDQMPADGTVSFTPADDWQQLSLHVLVTDAAGNQNASQKLLQRPRVATAATSQLASTIHDGSVSAHPAGYRRPSLGATAPVTSPQPVGTPKSAGMTQSAETPAAEQAVSPDPLPVSGHEAVTGHVMENTATTENVTVTEPMAPTLGSDSAPAATVAEFHTAQQHQPTPNLASPSTSNPGGYRRALDGDRRGLGGYRGATGQLAPSSPAVGQLAQTAPEQAQVQTSALQPYAAWPNQPPRGDQHVAADPRATENAIALRTDGGAPPYLNSANNLPRSSGESTLPPPASAQQNSNGSAGRLPSETATADIRPETAPAKGSPVQAAPAKRRPRTLAEAMRPLEQPSGNNPAQPSGNNPAQPPRGAGPQQTMTSATASKNLTANPAVRVETVPTPARSTAEQDGPEAPTERQVALRPVDVEGLAPLRFSDSHRFSLEYELEAVSRHGVEAVELWGSLDAGKSWRRWGEDPDHTSPFDIETNGEGIFGFRIVVLGGNGLASPRPLAGETPDILVAVDKTAPEVKLTGARYGEGDRIGSLVVRYTCEDANLQPRPITLAFSKTPDGPWTTIAAGLQNEGTYVWPADPGLPRQLYLRIDATDRGGNMGSYVLDHPIDTQGLAPRGRIRGFRSLSDTSVPASGAQTAAAPSGTLK